MSTYFLRISSCISEVEGPVGFGPENEMLQISILLASTIRISRISLKNTLARANITGTYRVKVSKITLPGGVKSTNRSFLQTTASHVDPIIK